MADRTVSGEPTDTSIRAGLAEGWRATRPYLLSHHRPAEWDRCYAVAVGDRRVHLCARCLGIYPGILLGLAAFLLAPGLGAERWPTSLALVAALPAPALLDWALAAFTNRAGSNPVRTVTGLLLGVGYGLGLGLLFGAGRLAVLGVGAAYGAFTVAGLALENRG